MTHVTYKNVHNRFRLNGIYLDKNDLCRVAYSLIKEGEAFEKSIGDFLLDWFDDKTFIDLHTSGTTGEPKKIRMDKQTMVHSALATGDFFELNPGDKALYCLPTEFIAGKMMLVRSFILGLDVDFVEPTSSPLKKNTTKYDFVAMVPMQAKKSTKKLSNVKKLIVGGAKMSKALEEKLLQLNNTSIYETYGMTETITHIAARKIGEPAFSLLPSISISQNNNGCLVINAPNILKEPLETNDMIEIVNENQFVFLGRIDNVVNSGAIKLIPEIIEPKLAKIIEARYFVGGLADAELGEKLVLVIEGMKMPFDLSSLDFLDKYERPKEVYFVPKFKDTDTGKIKRKEILKSLS